MNGEVTWTTTAGDHVEVYRQPLTCYREGCTVQHRAFRYRIQAANGEIVEQGSESYTRRSAAIEAALRHHPRVES